MTTPPLSPAPLSGRILFAACALSALCAFLPAVIVANYLDEHQQTPTTIVTVDAEALLDSFLSSPDIIALDDAELATATQNWARRVDQIVTDISQVGGVVVINSTHVAAGAEDVTHVVSRALQ